MRRDREVDALVIGGGPAGATAAALLASWGHSAVLVHRDNRQPSLAESLPSSTRKLLRFLGQLEAVDHGRFHPNRGNISRWAGRDAVATTAAPGYHVLRSRFDRLLRRHARSRGATILTGTVSGVGLATTPVVDCLSGSRLTIRPAFVLDCSGRAGIVARRGLRRSGAGYRTLAVAAEWSCRDWPEDERETTFVESYADGWAWSVPVSSGRRQCTVMLDADRTAIKKSALASLYSRELRKAVSLSRRLSGCRQATPPWACDASLYDCTRAVDEHVVLVGDAASFIEPLSSAGVKKALTSAWRAAVLVHTCLSNPHMLGPASDFHTRREREVYDDCLRRSTAFFRTAAAAHDDPFWAARLHNADVDSTATQGNDAGLDPSLNEAVRRAWSSLRDIPTLDVRPAPDLRFHQVAVIEKREIVLRDAVVVPGFDEPVRFWKDVNLPELIRIAAGCGDVTSVVEAYHRDIAAIDPRNVLLALSLVTACGLVVRTTEHRG